MTYSKRRPYRTIPHHSPSSPSHAGSSHRRALALAVFTKSHAAFADRQVPGSCRPAGPARADGSVPAEPDDEAFGGNTLLLQRSCSHFSCLCNIGSRDVCQDTVGLLDGRRSGDALLACPFSEGVAQHGIGCLFAPSRTRSSPRHTSPPPATYERAQDFLR